jgi:hypothetical protein
MTDHMLSSGAQGGAGENCVLRTRGGWIFGRPTMGGGGGALPAEERQLCALSPGRHYPGLDLK